jgi:hypothetical protein
VTDCGTGSPCRIEQACGIRLDSGSGDRFAKLTEQCRVSADATLKFHGEDSGFCRSDERRQFHAESR